MEGHYLTGQSPQWAVVPMEGELKLQGIIIVECGVGTLFNCVCGFFIDAGVYVSYRKFVDLLLQHL